jgi:hypothetical protein
MQPNLPPELDIAELQRGDIGDRLALSAAAVPEGEGHSAQRLIQATHEAASPWFETTLEIDELQHPAQRASVYDDQITFAPFDAGVVFVHTRGWDGPLALRSGMDRPDLSSWVDR